MRRLAILGGGFVAITIAAWAFSYVTPDALDRRLLLALNPDAPIPLLDSVMLAATDYALPCVAVLLFLWGVGVEALLRGWLSAARLSSVFIALAVAMPTFAYAWFGTDYTDRSVPIAMTPLIAAAFLWLAATVRRFDAAALARVRRAFWLAIVSIALAELSYHLAQGLGRHRDRPFGIANDAWNGALRVFPDEHVRGGHAYPSGHAVAICALLGPLFWVARNRVLRAVACAVAIGVVHSRVYVAAHFPSDAIAGAAIGAGIATLVCFTLDGRPGAPPG